ncbi:hypothetical protein VYU27_001852 [Nannochloropsis oceanica]
MQVENGGNPGHQGFAIAPVSSIKRHFMVVDNKTSYLILKVVRGTPEEMDEAESEAECPAWLKRLAGMSESDLRADVVLVKTAWDETFRVRDLRNRGEFNDRIATDGFSLSVYLSVAKEKREKERQQKWEYPQQDGDPRIVAIDPGGVNLVTALDSRTGKIKKLTRNEYDEKGWINECNGKFKS